MVSLGNCSLVNSALFRKDVKMSICADCAKLFDRGFDKYGLFAVILNANLVNGIHEICYDGYVFRVLISSMVCPCVTLMKGLK